MHVHRCSSVQNSHTTIAAMVELEAKHIRGRSVTGLLSAGVCAICARVAGAVCGALWLSSEALYTVPRLISIAMTTIKQREEDENKGQTFVKIMNVWSGVCKTQVLQGLGFVAATTVPELLYAFDGKKTFYHHHVETFVNTLSDFPHVDDVMFASFGQDVLQPMAKLWLSLGRTNEEFKLFLKQTLRKEMQKNDSFDLFDVTSLGFIRFFFKTITKEITSIIQEKTNQNTLYPIKLEGLNPLYCNMMYSDLSPDSRKQIFEVRPDLEENLEMHTEEVNIYFEAMHGFKFRPPQMVAFSNILLDKMKAVKNDFVRDRVFTVDEIEEMGQTPYSAIVCHGIYYMALQAEVKNSGEMIFTTRSGKKAVLKNDKQLFDARPALSELHHELKQLNSAQNAVLLKLLQFKEEATIDDPLIQSCFNKIVAIRHGLIEAHVMKNDGLRDEDQTPWVEAFTCS